ncbi:LLM class flavin-dependent oxidoreductase [Baekduia soli]|uniref:LLM class flavin-dependent oxidoreductase n=1 Tax=Baekduia soli TaxID=496014 RepID=A0A5B8U6E6_9ACTN|nr:LLM class flavin-dependent oxidoreductase [Baekduia soli]QEC48709.1 LLM class flavin-dependent oxidoreductase [Baekduia soli]
MSRWGVLLPTFDPFEQGRLHDVPAAARHAEALCFDAVWAGDHLACHVPLLDAPTALAAAAAVTDRVALGLSVLLLGLRPTAWAAKQLATIDVLSGGRLLLGVGVGGEFPEEFTAAGVPLSRRGARLDEALSVLPDLLAGRPVRHDGPALALDVPALAPALPATPPIYVGGRGEPALRRAARFADTWLPMWLDPPTLAQRAQELGELAAGHGRPAPGVALLFGVCLDEDEERARREAEAHLARQYRLPLRVVERWTMLGTPERVAPMLAAHAAAGVGEFIAMPLGRDPVGQYERLTSLRALVDGPASAIPTPGA